MRDPTIFRDKRTNETARNKVEVRSNEPQVPARNYGGRNCEDELISRGGAPTMGPLSTSAPQNVYGEFSRNRTRRYQLISLCERREGKVTALVAPRGQLLMGLCVDFARFVARMVICSRRSRRYETHGRRVKSTFVSVLFVCYRCKNEICV